MCSSDLKVWIKNTGSADGSEVVQLYVHDVISRLDRPEKELKGFQKVFLKVGEEKEITIPLSKKDFASYSTALKQWVTEPGEFKILVGSSSKDIKVSQVINIQCKNPFGLTENNGIGEIVANEMALNLINKVLHIDIAKVVNVAIVFAPEKTWKEVWSSSIVPVLKNKGYDSRAMQLAYQKIIAGFANL